MIGRGTLSLARCVQFRFVFTLIGTVSQGFGVCDKLQFAGGQARLAGAAASANMSE